MNRTSYFHLALSPAKVIACCWGNSEYSSDEVMLVERNGADLVKISLESLAKPVLCTPDDSA